MRNGTIKIALTLGVASISALVGCSDGGGESTGGGGSGGSTTSSMTGGDGGTGGESTGGTGGQGTGGSGGSTGIECGPGATLCGDTCTVTEFDPANCGACGVACEAQQWCSEGQCVSDCGSGALALCGELCVDLQTDAANCGACGESCSGIDVCVAGQCTTPVAPSAVYTMTNDPSGNQILSFLRGADGSLSPSGTLTPTGGKGTGAGLGNQHGLVFDAASSRFFAVNAGDHTISMLELDTDGKLLPLSTVASGGERPISVTVSGNTVYALNAGIAANGTMANITGFEIMGDTLAPIAGATRPLSAANPNPAQIQFSPDGARLVVTEKGTNMLDTYVVTGGVADGPMSFPAAGQTPFGFDFSKNQQVIVSEAWGGMAGLSTASSYSLAANGALTPVTAAIPTTRTSACWLVVSKDHAYMANAMTGDITGFNIADDGTLAMMNPNGITGVAGKAPVDEDVTDDDAFLYVVNNGDHSFSIFGINADGSLTKKPDFLGLPSTVSGIVAR